MNAKILLLIRRFFVAFEFGIADLNTSERSRVWTRPATENMLPYLAAKNAEGKHIFMRPVAEREPYYVLHDDAGVAEIFKHHGFDAHRRPARALPGRLIIETSPGNYQAWVRLLNPATPEEKQCWLDSVGADPGATPRRRWGRAPGSRNVKPKHRKQDGTFPLARLIWLNATEMESIKIMRPYLRTPRRIPPARRYLPELSIEDRTRFDVGDDSRTDMRWCLSLLARGYDAEAVRMALILARAVIGWNNHHHEDYVERTVRRAIEFLGKR
jgi:hypothetical protein